MIWIGAMMTLLCTSWFGYQYSVVYTKREQELKQLIFSFHIMDAEITYNQATLQETFYVISERMTGPLRVFYEKLAIDMSGTVHRVSTIWNDHCRTLQQGTALKKEDITVLQQFGETIGDYALYKQHEQIVLTMTYLEQLLEEAAEERKRYSKVYSRLGIFIGLFIIILLM